MATKSKLVINNTKGSTKVESNVYPSVTEPTTSSSQIVYVKTLVDTLTANGFSKVDTIPTTSTQAGIKNTISFDSDYMYIWTSANTVKKIAMLAIE